jgi:hypothetical protein
LIGDIQANIVHSAPDTLLSAASIVDKGNSTVTFNKTSCGGRRSLSDEVKSKVKQFNSTVTTNYVGYYTQNL